MQLVRPGGPRKYHYINEPLIRTLAIQYGILNDAPSETENEFTINIKPISYKRRSKPNLTVSLTDPTLVFEIEDKLRLDGRLEDRRPELRPTFRDEDEFHHRFIYEEKYLTPVTLQMPEEIKKIGPDILTVWVGDAPETSSLEHWRYPGSFLFLVQELSGDSYLPHAVSGASALAAVLHLQTTGGSITPGFLSGIDRSDPRFDDSSDLHPLEKLRQAGGFVHSRRHIQTVYRIAYMTNEQAFTQEGHKRRCHDILAYPLYVAD